MKEWLKRLSPKGMTTAPYYSFTSISVPHMFPAIQSIEITPLATASDWFIDSMHEVGRFSKLATDWDSYGSPAITREATRGALRILTLMGNKNAPPPVVAPVSGGGIQLEFSTGPKSLELEVLPDGNIEFLRVYEDDRMVEGGLNAENTGHLRENFAWLVS